MVKVFVSLVAVAAAASCSDDEKTMITGLSAKDFGDKSNKCGTQALGLTGINHDKFNSCMKTEVGIDTACSECYAVTADYGFKNCKAACLLGWCKEGCLSCTQPAQDDLPACTGFEAGKADPCNSLESKQASCSDDEKAMITGLSAKDFGDKSNKCGTQALGLTGINHDKFNSCMKTEVGIDSACSECYAVTADYGFKNCKAACLLGWCKEGCLSCTQPAQDDLPACTGFEAAKADPCNSLESKQASCSDDEKAMITGLSAKDFGDKSNKCGTQALGLTGINHDKFNSCMKTEVGIDTACSECYAVTADYGFKNCKAACLLGWCKSGCLSCTQPAQDDLPACTGFEAGKADPCNTVSAKAGACSADEQKLITGMAAKDFGDKSNKCGTQALGLSGINHDKFNGCMKTEVGIDTACSECYAVTADYGFKNCKAACLLGWCKSGCLSCTQPAQDDLPACTGFEAGKADPCNSDVVV